MKVVWDTNFIVLVFELMAKREIKTVYSVEIWLIFKNINDTSIIIELK
jgi:hypothetical protein